MALKAKLYAASALRALTYRIAATPTAELPRHAAQLAAAVWTCREILSTPADTLKQDSELAVTVHRFKTQLSTLLQDRTLEGRWAGVVLVKTTIEAGGVEVLSKANPWVRYLLSILKRHDPSTTRTLAVLTLTRIFMLTWDYSNLVREITTPNLPAFISTGLNNADHARCSGAELQSILESFETLLPRHPTIFRANMAAVRALLIRVIDGSSRPQLYHAQHISTAQRLIVLLSVCAPKQGGADQWNSSLEDTIKATHTTCDLVFMPVLESWKSTVDSYKEHGTSNRKSGVDIRQIAADALGLGAWQGVYAGGERLTRIIDQLTSHVDVASPGTVQIRIGMIMDLVNRIAAITSPGFGKQTTIQSNPQIARDEREALFSVLPRIHLHVFKMIQTLLLRLGDLMLPNLSTIVEVIRSIITAEAYDDELRAAAYDLAGVLLQWTGPGLNQDQVSDLGVLISSCCVDCSESASKSDNTQSAGQTSKQQSTNDLELGLMSKTEPSNPTTTSSLQQKAASLLPLLLSHIEAALLPRRLRTQIDKTAILTRNKSALLSSVLSPPPSPSGHGLQSSVLPFLARLFPGDPEVEALIRPRMPYVHSQARQTEAGHEDDQKMADGDESAEEEGGENEDADESMNGDTAHTALPFDTPSEYTTAQAEPGDKRGLESDSDDSQENDPKRTKHITASSQIQSEWQQALESTTTLPQRAPALTSTTSIPVVEAAVEASTADEEDESDFEMPPLTIEQDTDDDDE